MAIIVDAELFVYKLRGAVFKFIVFILVKLEIKCNQYIKILCFITPSVYKFAFHHIQEI